MLKKLLETRLVPCVLLALLFSICACSSESDGTDSNNENDTGTDSLTDVATDSSDDTDVDGGTDTTVSDIFVSLDAEILTFDTPDMTQQLTATVEGDDTNSVTWTTSDSYIATVDSAGTVTSVSGGTATITATSNADNTKSASCEVTILEPDRHIADDYVDATSITSGPVNIIMCGDSTMKTYTASTSDQTGWGQVLSEFFNTDVSVDNSLSNGGRSSRSFYNEPGRWDTAKTLLESATGPTFVFIQFAHNDQRKVTDDEGPERLTFARSNQNGTTAGTFYDYLERYITEARELGGVPILFTPFVRAYVEDGEISQKGQHNVTEVYSGETAARGNYPEAMKEIAAKHDVPLIDLTAASKIFVEAHAASETLNHVYISGDETHERSLGALLLAHAAVKGLDGAGILSNYIQYPSPRVMLDTNSMSFGSMYTGTTKEDSFQLTAYGDVTGTIDITAPEAYTISIDGETFTDTLSIVCDSSWIGQIVQIRFAPADIAAYNGTLSLTHSAITPDYGNTPPNDTAGTIEITGIGKEAVSGEPATATWPLVNDAGEWIAAATTQGVISASEATLVGLSFKDGSIGARLTTLEGAWTAEASRREERYIQFTVPVSTGTFHLDEIAMSIGSGGGSKMQWDIVYSTEDDFSVPVELVKVGTGSAKDNLDNWSEVSIGLPVEADTSLYLRVYPYYPDDATGKYLLIKDVSLSGVTN